MAISDQNKKISDIESQLKAKEVKVLEIDTEKK